jgi:hypothetical protein
VTAQAFGVAIVVAVVAATAALRCGGDDEHPTPSTQIDKTTTGLVSTTPSYNSDDGKVPYIGPPAAPLR